MIAGIDPPSIDDFVSHDFVKQFPLPSVLLTFYFFAPSAKIFRHQRWQKNLGQKNGRARRRFGHFAKCLYFSAPDFSAIVVDRCGSAAPGDPWFILLDALQEFPNGLDGLECSFALAFFLRALALALASALSSAGATRISLIIFFTSVTFSILRNPTAVL